jgi:hypothetical protein
MRREGLIKINPRNFNPVVSWKTGRVLDERKNGWRTGKQFEETQSWNICEEQIDKAFKNLGEKVEFIFVDAGSVSEAKIIKWKKRK